MNKVHSSDGTAIAYDKSGKGPAVILVGGALQNRMGNARLAALLAQHFTVFNYDRRGRGDSGDTAQYEVKREVEDLETLINEAVLGSGKRLFGEGGPTTTLRLVDTKTTTSGLVVLTYEPDRNEPK